MALEWDELRFFLAVARGGSLSAAARSLRVNHSTVFRRMTALEERLGVRLFERLPTGYGLTTAGEDMLATAARVEEEVQALDRRLSGRDLALHGLIRVTAPDDLAFALLMAPLRRFREGYPGITLEMVIDNRNLNLSRREADVAVRPTRRPPSGLVGRRIGPLASAVYGSRTIAGGMPEPSLAERTWIGWEEGLGPAVETRWLAETVPAERVVYRSNSLLNHVAAVRSALGVAVLPCCVADADPELVRLTPPIGALDTDLWLLTHPDLRRTARIRVFLESLAEALRRERPRLAGLAAAPAALPSPPSASAP